MEKTSVNRSDYSNTRGERFDSKRPNDSNILRGSGPLNSDTISRREFKEKKAERSTAKRPETSDMWKVDRL